MASGTGYAKGTSHPWPCLLFMLPLLVAYEVGVVCLGGDQPDNLRNGADLWLRFRLTKMWSFLGWLPPVVLLVVFIGFTVWRWSERPKDLTSVLSGMVLESVGFALGLWGLARALAPMLNNLGVELSLEGGEAGFRQVVQYIGAGIYEEAIFRLVLFTVVTRFLIGFELKDWLASLLAAIGSATLFSTGAPRRAVWPGLWQLRLPLPPRRRVVLRVPVSVSRLRRRRRQSRLLQRDGQRRRGVNGAAPFVLSLPCLSSRRLG